MSTKGCEGAFSAWMHRTAMEASINCFGDGYYAGESGARRLARECGYKIPEFRDYGEDHIGDTYRGGMRDCVPDAPADWRGGLDGGRDRGV